MAVQLNLRPICISLGMVASSHAEALSPSPLTSTFTASNQASAPALAGRGGFGAPAVFAHGSGSQGPGSASGSSGGGNRTGGRWRSAADAVDALAADFGSMKEPGQLKDRIMQDTALLGDISSELEYFSRLTSFMNEHPEAPGRFRARGYVDIIHFLAQLIEGSAEEANASQVAVDPEYHPSVPLGIILQSSAILVRDFKIRKKLDNRMLEQFADIQTIFATKGIRSVPRKMLLFSNAEAVYSKLGRRDKAGRVRAEMELIKSRHSIADETVWMNGVLSTYLEHQTRKVMEEKKHRADELARFNKTLEEVARSMIIHAPHIYRETARIFEIHGHKGLAQDFLTKAEYEEAMLAAFDLAGSTAGLEAN